jgi:hypothetical protein
MVLSLRSRRDLGAAVAVLVLCVLLFPGALLRGELFFERDLHLDWYPRLEALDRCLREGAWPLWDTSISFGQPLLADPGAQVLYPFTWLALAVPGSMAYTIFAVLHLLIAAVGMSRLAARLGAGSLGAVAAAVFFVLSGPVQSSVNLWHHFAGLAWMPWVLLGVERCLHRPRRETLAGCIMPATLQILAGSADVCAMTVGVSGGWVAFRLLQRRRGRGWRGLLALVLAAGLAVGLSATLWWPAADVLSRSPREELPLDIRTAWSVPAGGLWRTVLPLDPDRVPFVPETWTALYDRPERPFLSSLYLGLPVLAAVAAALVSRRHRRSALVLAAVGATGVALAMGPHGAVYSTATELLPALKVFRYPSKTLFLVAFVVALLGGMGVGAISRRGLTPRVQVALAVALLLAAGTAGLVGMGLWVSLSPLASPALAAASGMVLLLGSSDRLRPIVTALALAGLALGDLLLAHAWLNPTAPPDLVFDPPPVVSQVDRAGHRRLYVYDYHSLAGTAERLLGRTDPYRVGPPPPGWSHKQLQAAGQRLYLVPPSAGLFGLEGSYDLDIRGLYSRPLNDITFFLRHVEGTPVHGRLLRMGAVGTVLSLHEQGLEDLDLEVVLPSLFPEAIRVWRVPGGLPRTWVVGGARVADEREAFETLAAPMFDPAAEVLLPKGRPRTAPKPFVGSSRVELLDHDRVRLDVSASAPAFVVLADAYDPGWRATVDGRPTPVIRANVAFRAVAVGAGRHVVEMAYRPRALLRGLTLSGISLLLFLGVVFGRARGARRGRAGSPPGPLGGRVADSA